MAKRRARASRIATPSDVVAACGPADYVTTYAIVAPSSRTAEQWARLIFESAPAALRVPIVLGWRTVLRLRLTLPTSPDHVLGWRITDTTDRQLGLEAASSFLLARKVVRLTETGVHVSTSVAYRRWYARLIWPVVAVIHHRTEPLLINRASERGR